ncbi:MAG: calcium-binding protein, partial [Pseudomonadota bacterium]
LIGGRGADRFIFNRNDGDDVIRDFDDGLDRIQINSGAQRFRDLDIERSAGDVLITFADTTIRVLDAVPGDFSGADFLF